VEPWQLASITISPGIFIAALFMGMNLATGNVWI
jgi:hypothetical protein